MGSKIRSCLYILCSLEDQKIFEGEQMVSDLQMRLRLLEERSAETRASGSVGFDEVLLMLYIFINAIYNSMLFLAASSFFNHFEILMQLLLLQDLLSLSEQLQNEKATVSRAVAQNRELKEQLLETEDR